MVSFVARRLGVAVCSTVALAGLLAGCERPPVEPVQGGYRGTGMVQVYSTRRLDADAALNAEPEVARPAPVRPGQPTAGQTYENVQVLGDLSLAEFGRTMTAITAWVAPEQGCLYCHEGGNLASDALYTKKVARRMFQMTQFINAQWKTHVADTGVTCYTCHRGHPVPRHHWTLQPEPARPALMIGNRAGQNEPARAVGLTSLPNQPFRDFLLEERGIRVNGTQALPARGENAPPRAGIQDAERTYGLMLHMSQALGVNCTFCHHAQAMQVWELSSRQRMTAWYGIAMVRQINQDYLSSDPLLSLFPAQLRGPQGDLRKVNCATCHQGAYKPLYGSHLAGYYPAVVPATMRPKVPRAPPEPKHRLPAVRAELLLTGARDPSAPNGSP